MLDLISLGECMIEFYCDGSISKAAHFHKAYGGDALNTVVAAARPLHPRAGALPLDPKWKLPYARCLARMPFVCRDSSFAREA